MAVVVFLSLLLSLVHVEAQQGYNVETLGQFISQFKASRGATFKPAVICPNGERVIGFRAHVQKPGDVKDKVGLTALEMKCNSSGTIIGPVGVANSELGDWGDWLTCSNGGFVTEFNLRYDSVTKDARYTKDIVGATQIRMKCSNGDVLGPDGIEHGKWAKEGDANAACSASSTLCGFAAEVQDFAGGRDDVGINRIKFLCCRPAKSVDALPGWITLGSNLCIGGQKDRYGFLKMPTTGFLSAVQLVYLEGSVTCHHRNPAFESNFGCGHWRGVKDSFSIWITSSSDQAILPDGSNQRRTNDAFYEVVGKSGDNAKSFTLYSEETPFFFRQGDEMRLWYGEDLRKRGETDNGDNEVCVNVYGQFNDMS